MTGMSETMAQLGAAQKSSRGAPAYSRFINRPLGRPLAAVAASLSMTPTHVTLLSAAATLSGIACIALLPATATTSLLVTALLVLGYALDSADGQLARLQRSFSLSGEWLDHLFDALKAVTIHLAVLAAWLRFPDLDQRMLIVPPIFAAVASTFFFGVVAVDLLRRIHRAERPADPAPAPAPPTSVLYALLVAPADYGVLCLLFLTLFLPSVFVPLYTALAVINGLLLLASAMRWHRSLRALESSR
jgi:phosphatidylglycerophosphate synthase